MYSFLSEKWETTNSQKLKLGHIQGWSKNITAVFYTEGLVQ